jgi:hypothetical protein
MNEGDLEMSAGLEPQRPGRFDRESTLSAPPDDFWPGGLQHQGDLLLANDSMHTLGVAV